MSRYSRRRFLQGIGAGAALLPILETEWARADGAFPRRLLVLVKNNGSHLPKFFPPKPAALETSLMEAPLPEVLSPVEAFKKDLVLLGGIEQTSFKEIKNYNGHGSSSHILTGQVGKLTGEGTYASLGGGISLDQFIAKKIAETVRLPFPVVNLGSAVGGLLSWSARDRLVAQELDPVRAFDRLFAGAKLSTTDADRIRAERKSILDYLKGEIGEYGRRLGTEDRARIDRHLTGVRDLEQSLQSLGRQQACAPQLPVSKGFATWTNEHKGEYVKALTEIAVQALMCDATRVATNHFVDSNFPMTFAGSQFNVTCTGTSAAGMCDAKANAAATYHDITHHQYRAEFTPLKVAADKWWVDNMLGIALRRLSAVREGNGTMLDNTVILFADDMANGAVHNQTDMPWLIAGRAGGRIRTGRYLHQGRVVPHNGVLIAIAHAMGFPVETFGDPKYGGIFPGIVG